jgi:predicted O-linked N-acetylglucosamine transferase (SPINDLY family)
MEIISKYTFSSRVHKYNALQHDEYLNLVRISDIVLETFPFGSCNSSLEAFSLSKPVVTLPSDIINGRFTLGFYKFMGINDVIAKSKNDYIDIVSKLTMDKKFYDKISNDIKNNSNKLFMDKNTCLEYENLFRNLKL